MAEDKIEVFDFRKLAKNRSDIQTLLVDLYEFDVGLKAAPKARVWPIYGYLVGVAFSLWRAVFFSTEIRGELSIRDRAVSLLREVIETNAIGFPQERMVKAWMGGFYINNARMRLYLLSVERDCLQVLNTVSSGADIQFFKSFGPDPESEQGTLRPMQYWEEAFAGLVRAYNLMLAASKEDSER